MDNFGDIGICWRLARELARREAAPVRLWVDDWNALCHFVAGVHSGQDAAVIDEVELRHWRDPLADAVLPGEIVIEAFACELPESFQAAMAQQAPVPVWINLEYLSAEAWVADCHGLASPHPRLSLVKHFFFPGFADQSGGLIREAGLLARRDAFLADAEAQQRWRTAQAIDAERSLVSLFCYPRAPLAGLFECWAQGPQALTVLVPESSALPAVAAACGRSSLRAGERVERGTLELIVLPFATQDAYDELLWRCELNFVRGEDSFVRAQWAGRAFVWQIYAQAEDAHLAKLEAFLARYHEGMKNTAAQAQGAFWQAWNGVGGVDALATAWPAFAAALPAVRPHALAWSARQAEQSDLCARLIEFCSHFQAHSV